MSITFRTQAETQIQVYAVNMSNRSAMDLFGVLGLEFDWCGEWTLTELPEIRREIIRCLNLSARRDSALRTEVTTVGEKGCKSTEFANCDEQTVRRLGGLLDVVVMAQVANCGVFWS